MMEKYIRTKDGIFKIEENIYNQLFAVNQKGEWIPFDCVEDHIIKKANTIEELIMPDDLIVQSFIYWHQVEKIRDNNVLRCTDMHLIPSSEVSHLYITSDGEKTYHLVAEREVETEKLELVKK